MNNTIIIKNIDNVGNAVEDIAAGSNSVYLLSGEVFTLQALEDIPFGYKIALKGISLGGDIIKYGEVIGRASKEIAPGELVHVHNVEGCRGRGDLEA